MLLILIFAFGNQHFLDQSRTLWPLEEHGEVDDTDEDDPASNGGGSATDEGKSGGTAGERSEEVRSTLLNLFDDEDADLLDRDSRHAPSRDTVNHSSSFPSSSSHSNSSSLPEESTAPSSSDSATTVPTATSDSFSSLKGIDAASSSRRSSSADDQPSSSSSSSSSWSTSPQDECLRFEGGEVSMQDIDSEMDRSVSSPSEKSSRAALLSWVAISD